MSSGKTIFDFLKDIFQHKPDWSSYSEQDKKSFSVYMINRFISMDKSFLPIINELQYYTLSVLSPEQVYKLYSSIFPKMNFFAKYVKNSNKDKEKYTDELIKFFVSKYPWNEKECIDNLDILGRDNILEELQKYGLTDQELKKFKLDK